MKTYFTKYFPVEGEIKDGDIGLDPFGLPYHCKDGKMLDSDESTYYLLTDYKDKFKKVKLFLCSKDIQAGDKFDQLPGINGVCYICKGNANRFLLDDEGKYRAIETCFKVIGEISPEAIWVKEEDEFGEDDISFEFGIPYEDDTAVEYQTWKENKHKYYKTIKILCQTCKTFH